MTQSPNAGMQQIEYVNHGHRLTADTYTDYYCRPEYRYSAVYISVAYVKNNERMAIYNSYKLGGAYGLYFFEKQLKYTKASNHYFPILIWPPEVVEEMANEYMLLDIYDKRMALLSDLQCKSPKFTPHKGYVPTKSARNT